MLLNTDENKLKIRGEQLMLLIALKLSPEH